MSQTRLPLRETVQQHAPALMASIVALQLQSSSADVAFEAEKDMLLMDATAAPRTATLPGATEVHIGKPYAIKEVSGSNAVTVGRANSSDTIDGAASNGSVGAGETVVYVATAADVTTGIVTWQVYGQTTAPEAGSDASAIHDDTAGEIAAIAAKAVPVDADTVLIEDSAAADAKKSTTIEAIRKVGHTLEEIGSDGAAAILDTTRGVALAESASGAKAIATTSSYPGQVVHLFLLAASGGSYTLVVEEGTLTLDAAGESAVVMRTNADDAWKVVGLTGATIV